MTEAQELLELLEPQEEGVLGKTVMWQDQGGRRRYRQFQNDQEAAKFGAWLRMMKLGNVQFFDDPKQVQQYGAQQG